MKIPTDTTSSNVGEPATERRSGVRASLRLDFDVRAHDGRTTLASSVQEPPLRVVRAFEQGDGAALVHLHNVSGGLLGGDELALAVNLGAGGRLQMTTTGATRIYRPRAEALPATQTTEISVGENALLEYVPDALIPFAGSRYEQSTTIRLQEGAGLFWWEIVSPGREASGEVFAYDSLKIGSDLFAKSQPIASERVQLDPRARTLQSSARLGRYRSWATFYICRVGVKNTDWLNLEAHLREVAAGFGEGRECLWGVSTLVAHGLAVRGLAVHGRELLAGLQALWRAAKVRLYGCEPVLPRKVN